MQALRERRRACALAMTRSEGARRRCEWDEGLREAQTVLDYTPS